MNYKIGLIGLVGEELNNDRWGTLKKLAEAGYQGLEGAALVEESLDATHENRKRLNDLGLESVALSCKHFNPELLDGVIEQAQAIGAKYIVTYWGPTDSEEQLEKDAGALETMAKRCQDAGLTYCYHNHSHEFANLFGPKATKYALEILMEHAPSAAIELDVAWCHFGGADPVMFLRQYGQRIPIIHVKDFYDDNICGRFTAVGTGVVDCMACIEAAAAQGTQWMVVEQDKPHNLTGMESALAAIYNIREAGLR